MRQLFAPWRFAYVTHAGASQQCVLCAAVGGGEDTLTLARGERAFALLNRFPYTSGHAMVAPVAHVADLSQLDAATLSEMMSLLQRIVRALTQVYQPHGFNIGFNLGEAAGAGIADHLHLHVVPRWRGDTNFMAVTADVRVIPEELTETRAKLRRALEAPDG
ncbi:MAG TPA: HIT domain-containing protein [Thermoanaerobaculaceae bacterium]|nr:HIT domain-containing protein [Thermoanaerobaculaceae bacterium]